MNFISLCSHKAIVSMKESDADIILKSLDNYATRLSMLPESKTNYSELQKELRKIKDLERKFLSIKKWTTKNEQKNN